jgi:predicted anti-sigma-YlaC factor YlaD
MHCDDATRALSAAQEQPLAFGERVALRLHLALCRNCRNFGQQVAFLRESMRAYARRPDGSPATARNEGKDASSE